MFIPEVSENINDDLKEIIDEIIYMAKTADESGESEIQFEFHNPASDDEIAKCEKELNVKLLDDYKDFIRFSNGSQLCFTEAIFYDMDYVISINKKGKAEDFPQDYIILADITGDGEVLCFSDSTNKFIRYFDGDETIFDTFIDFMKELVSGIRDSVEEYVDL